MITIIMIMMMLKHAYENTAANVAADTIISAQEKLHTYLYIHIYLYYLCLYTYSSIFFWYIYISTL